ncbi:hypothetical protein C0075_08565 [Rhizobium sp. KAs_5_22]|uniref:hypothetical protein n=1 Tax=Ciceribacter selenitireducens TaxID=448181 RepID=UPI000490E33E|nr:hypothetical protein [Ciceribacter selenitireducens]PPJ45776.1 hypothetical protein C0075_08565 [Rhizobium sp. KAs_5_22]
MADFIAVIRRAVDGLSNNTPEMRAKVYDKARSAVLRQLENMNPRPPEQMLQRQLAKLDAAILEVEAEHAEALPDEQAANTFEEAMTPQPVEEEWREEQPPVSEAPADEPQPVAEAVPEVVSQTPSDEVEDPWAEPAEPEYRAQSEPEPEYRAEPEPYFAPVQEPERVAAPEPFFEEPVRNGPVHWAEEPVEPVAEPALSATPAYLDVDHYAVPVIEPEEAYAAPAVDEEPEEHRESVRAAEAEVAAAETVVAEPTPTVPAYNRLVEMPLTSGDGWMPTRGTDFGAPPTTVAPPQAEAAAEPVQAPAYESWELPAEAPHWPESAAASPAETSAWTEPAVPDVAATTKPAVPASLDLLDWESSAYAEPTAKPVDGQSRDMPAADDFSDWFAEYDKPKTPAAEAAAIAPGVVEPRSIPPEALAAAPAAPARGIEDVDAFLAESQQRAYRIEPKQGRNYAPIVLGLLGIVLVAGGGFAAWTYRDQVTQFVTDLTGSPPSAVTEQTPPGTSPTAETATSQPTPAADTNVPVNGTPDDGSVTGQKFTQRLMPDGTEVDEGVGTTAPGGASSEGKSVAEQNVASTVEPTDQPAVGTNAGLPQAATPAGTTPAGTTPAAGDTIAAAANGERVFLYEERLGQTSPTAVPGTVAWTALRETGEDGKPNPEIQGKITIPDRGLTALITIKRNSDSSLPASHLIEVVFSLPADFEGGAIDKLERIAMKRTEQDRGDPLVAVSAKVTDDTYLVALNDFEDVMKANLDLLSTRGWIDMPISYRNGRRALLTLDKGAAGKAVFDQVIKEWAALGKPGN